VVSTLVNGPVVALRKTKQAINAATLAGLAYALEREEEGQLVLIDSHDFREGTKAFQQRRRRTSPTPDACGRGSEAKISGLGRGSSATIDT
jgi:enoyl-CoA hydratase/carnithine racemase